MRRPTTTVRRPPSSKAKVKVKARARGPTSAAGVRRRRVARERAGRPSGAAGLRRFWAGDRLFIVGLILLLGILLVLGIGPVQNLTAASERVDALEQQKDRLSTEVRRLARRNRRLQDPDQIELLARRELGLVKPGELPYVVVPPDGPDPNRLAPDRRPSQGPELPWYERLREAVEELFD